MQSPRFLQPVSDFFYRFWNAVDGYIYGSKRKCRFYYQFFHQFLLPDKVIWIVILGWFTGDLNPFFPRRRERLRSPGAEYEPKSERFQSLLKPSEVVILPVPVKLIRLCRDMKPVDNPGVISL